MILYAEVAWQRTYSLGQRVTERIKKRNAQVLEQLLGVSLVAEMNCRSVATPKLARSGMHSHQKLYG